jgi:hypothetical protein
MKRHWILGAALLLLPAAVSASHPVEVDVRILGGTGWDETTVVEFRANRSGYVALYATYSDGTIVPVFPMSSWQSHRVRGSRTYSVAVSMPCGVRIESVQAVASYRWFDPNECWVAAAPRYGWDRPGWVVTTVSHVPLWSFSFHLGWNEPSHGWTVVRTWSGEPRREVQRTWTRPSDRKWKAADGAEHTPSAVKTKGTNEIKVKTKSTAGGDGAAPPSRWTTGGSAKKVKSTPGTKSSSRNG